MFLSFAESIPRELVVPVTHLTPSNNTSELSIYANKQTFEHPSIIIYEIHSETRLREARDTQCPTIDQSNPVRGGAQLLRRSRWSVTGPSRNRLGALVPLRRPESVIFPGRKKPPLRGGELSGAQFTNPCD